jgi:undecaprenol kinase
VTGQENKNMPFAIRFGFAWAGIRAVWIRERSFRAQGYMAVLAIAVTAALRPGLLWCAAIAFAIALVLALELLNSSLEHLIDYLHPEIAAEIKIVKDAAAGAVLIASLGAASIGCLMLLSVLTQ